MDYELHEEPPSPAEYVSLRERAGLGARTEAAARRGLENGIYTVTIRRNGDLVGMGRLVGDDGCFYTVVDIAVAPVHQNRDLGTRIVETLVEYLEANAPPSAYVSLVADVEGFYRGKSESATGHRPVGESRKSHTSSPPTAGKTSCAADSDVSTVVAQTSGVGRSASIDARRERRSGTGRTQRLWTRGPLRPPGCTFGGRSRNPRVTGPGEVQERFGFEEIDPDQTGMYRYVE